MSKHPPRASGEYVNLLMTNSIKRAKPVVDRMAEMVGASGYPPLTLPITLRDLQKMPEEKAVATLRSELERTTIKDPETGEAHIQPKTLKLIADYFDWVKENGGHPAPPTEASYG